MNERCKAQELEYRMQVKVRNGNVDAALRVFKRKHLEKVWEVRERQFYEKPSLKRKTAKKAAIKRELKRKKV